MISICQASLKRPEIFKNFCNSVLNTADDPNDIEFVVYRNVADDSKYEYVGNHTEIWGTLYGFDPGVMECQKVAKGPIFGFFPDDVIFETKGWDTMVKDAFESVPDKIIFAYPNEHPYHSRWGADGFLHKNWIDTVGHFLVPGIVRGGDIWLNRVAMRLNRRHFLPDFITKNFDIRTDETHQLHYNLCEAVQNSEKFEELKKELRPKDIQLLKDFINNFKNES